MDWITDRLPTEDDADVFGDVIVGDGTAWEEANWYDVEPGQAWLAFKPATTTKRRIISTNRTVHPNGVAIIDAVADDGTGWWVAQGDDENGWHQLPPLPDREVG